MRGRDRGRDSCFWNIKSEFWHVCSLRLKQTLRPIKYEVQIFKYSMNKALNFCGCRLVHLCLFIPTAWLCRDRGSVDFMPSLPDPVLLFQLNVVHHGSVFVVLLLLQQNESVTHKTLCSDMRWWISVQSHQLQTHVNMVPCSVFSCDAFCNTFYWQVLYK